MRIIIILIACFFMSLMPLAYGATLREYETAPDTYKGQQAYRIVEIKGHTYIMFIDVGTGNINPDNIFVLHDPDCEKCKKMGIKR